MSFNKLHSAASRPFALKAIGIMAFLLIISIPVFAQNTKGDKPIKNQRQVRETKTKSVKKKERGSTRDIAGRRLRTKDKSSANRANASYPQPSPYAERKRTNTDRAAKPRGKVFTRSPRESRTRAWKGNISGHPIRRITPSKSGVARNNVYPQYGPYVNNPSRKPRKPDEVKVSNRNSKGVPVGRRTPTKREQAWKGNLRGAPVGTRSATGSVSNVYPQKNAYSRYISKSSRKKGGDKPYIKPGVGFGVRPGPGAGKSRGLGQSISQLFIKGGKKNVYWGKYRKGERAFTKDISGNPLRTRNFRSMPAGLVGRDTLRSFGRRPGGDRSYNGRGKRFSLTPSTQRPWKGDLAGRKVRSPRSHKGGDKAGQFVFPRKMSISGQGQRAGKLLPGGGYNTRSNRKNDNRPLPSKSPGIGGFSIGKALGKIKGRRTMSGGGSVSSAGWNNKGQPIGVNNGGVGSIRASKYQGNVKSFRSFEDQGARYSGNMKGSRRPIKGGGSVSGKLWNNRQSPIDVNNAGSGTVRASKYQGNIRSFRSFEEQGARYSGNIKTGRPIKGGGSVSGKLWNNRQTPINVRTPGSGSMRAGNFSGNIKAGRPLKGGGSVSGQLWNNRETPINVRTPGSGSMRAGNFSGNIKAGRPLKGGGSVSGKLWNNNETPIDPRKPGSGSIRAGNFSGNVKAGRPLKGGGSVSGKLWNNNETPIDPRKPGSGSIRAGNFSGNVKAGRPLKGGGSVSGKLWNNDEKPIEGREPKRVEEDGFSGRNKIRRGYIQNPNAAELSIKKRRPDGTTYLVNGLQVRIKRDKYEENPNAKEGALLGIGPKKNSRDANEYSGTLKVTRNYKHNPRSADDALDGISPTKTSVKASEYARSMKRYWDYKHAPLSADEALKVRNPGKAYARIGDFQGNIKMRKFNDHRLHPDAKFAHTHRGNTKEDRTILMDVKLMWAKLFKKSGTQPENVKEKVLKPRYDKGEKGLWIQDPAYEKRSKAGKAEQN